MTRPRTPLLILLFSFMGVVLAVAVFGFTILPLFAQSEGEGEAELENRNEDNAEATKSEAQRLQELQQEDLQKCLSQSASGLRGPMNEAIQEGVNSAASQALQEELPAALNQEIRQSLPQNLAEEVRGHLSEELTTRVREDLRQSLPQALNEASGGGSRQLPREELASIIGETMSQSVRSNLGDALASSIEAGIPTALEASVREGMPNAVQGIFQNRFPEILNQTLPGILHQELDGITQDLIIDQTAHIVENNPIGDILGGLFGGFEAPESLVTPEMVDELTQNMVDEYSSRALSQINASLPEITESLTSALDGELSSVIDQSLGSLDGLLDSSLDELTNSLDGELAGALNQITGQMDGLIDETLNGVLDDFSGALDPVFNELTGSLNGLIDNTIGEFTGVLDGALGNITGEILGPLTGSLDGVIGSVLDPVTGALGNITGSLLEPLGSLTENLTSNILSPLTDTLDGVVGGITESISGAAGDIANSVLGATGLPSAITGPVGEALSNVTSGLVADIPIVGDALGSLGIGVYVPVREVNGPLLSTTKSIVGNTHEIDLTTKRIEKLTIEMCTYLKSIQRIQTAFEQKEFLEDVDLRRQANQDSEEYRNDLIDYTKKGFDSTGQGPDAPLYVENLRAHMNEIVRPEARQVFLDDLKKSDDIFKDQTASNITVRESQSPDRISTITKEAYGKFVTGQTTTASEFWSGLFAVNDPERPNSPETSFIINDNILARQKEQAEIDAREQITAAQGYLPVRECEEYTEDGQACRRWKTVTPAIQVKESASKALNYRLDLYTDPEPGDVAPGNEPTLEETRTNTPSTGGGGGNGSGQFDIREIISMLGRLISGIGGNSGESGGSETPPNLTFTYTTPTSSELQTGSANTARLRWSGSKIANCTASSYWLTGTQDAASLIGHTAPGETISTSGERVIYLPVTFSLRMTRTRDGIINTIAASSTENTRFRSYEFTISPETFQPGDTVALAFSPFSNISTVSLVVSTNDTQASILNKLSQQITQIQATNQTNTSLQQAVFSRFEFSFNQANGRISVKPVLKYGLSCQTTTNTRIDRTIQL